MMFYFSFIKITETQDRNEGIWAKIKKQYYPFKQMDTLNLYIATFYELRDNARLEPLRAICIINQASPQANPNNSKGVMEAYAIGLETEVTIWADKKGRGLQIVGPDISDLPILGDSTSYFTSQPHYGFCFRRKQFEFDLGPEDCWLKYHQKQLGRISDLNITRLVNG